MVQLLSSSALNNFTGQQHLLLLLLVAVVMLVVLPVVAAAATAAVKRKVDADPLAFVMPVGLMVAVAVLVGLTKATSLPPVLHAVLLLPCII